MTLEFRSVRGCEKDPIREFYAQFGDKLPPELTHALEGLEQRLSAERG